MIFVLKNTAVYEFRYFSGIYTYGKSSFFPSGYFYFWIFRIWRNLRNFPHESKRDMTPRNSSTGSHNINSIDKIEKKYKPKFKKYSKYFSISYKIGAILRFNLATMLLYYLEFNWDFAQISSLEDAMLTNVHVCTDRSKSLARFAL